MFFYQIEDLERDLDFLVTNKNLITYQDIKNIQSIEEFKHKKYRYQMTDNAIEIERLTIYLEEMGKDFYENFYYDEIGTTQDEKTDFLSKYDKMGITVSLDTLSKYQNSKRNS